MGAGLDAGAEEADLALRVDADLDLELLEAEAARAGRPRHDVLQRAQEFGEVALERIHVDVARADSGGP